MKKVILLSLLLVAIATVSAGDVKSVLPYVGTINYSSSSNKSAKDKSVFGGVYANIGNLNYLLEMNYSYLKTSYKDDTIINLKQHDITLMYSQYYESFMFKGGIHHISTNDTDLGDGEIFIASVGGYKFSYYDAYTYGIEGYYSYYKDGHDENYASKKVALIQFTPYLGFFKTINFNNKNSINFKLNYIVANDYVKKSYTSYEISDTYYYRNLFGILKAHFGKMKTGIKNGGNTVYNSLNVMKNGYSFGLGYYINANFIVSASYGVETYTEYRKTEDGTSSLALASLSYRF